jgi:phosphoribosylglycinamide formyltransferase-1
MTKNISLGVLVSGSGTNLQAIIDNSISGKIAAEIQVVISDNKSALALDRAKKAGIQTVVHPKSDYKTKAEFEAAIANTLKGYNVDLVCLAGFMRILSPKFVSEFRGKIINIHPALLPSFPGLHGQKQAHDYGVKVSGCTVHFVDEGTDTGPIILQTAVPVRETDTEESLANRILTEEHKIYSEAIGLFAEGRLEIQGRRVVVRG